MIHEALEKVIAGENLTRAEAEAVMAEFFSGRVTHALFLMPSQKRFWLRLAGVMETLGEWLCTGLGGVVLMEAEKQIYASVAEPVAVRRRRPVLVPAAKPAMGRS